MAEYSQYDIMEPIRDKLDEHIEYLHCRLMMAGFLLRKRPADARRPQTS